VKQEFLQKYKKHQADVEEGKYDRQMSMEVDRRMQENLHEIDVETAIEMLDVMDKTSQKITARYRQAHGSKQKFAVFLERGLICCSSSWVTGHLK